MMFFDGAPSFSILVPLALLIGSLLVSRGLKLSLGWTLAGGLVPLALPFLPLPLSDELVKSRPDYVIGGGWMVFVGCAVGWVVVRPLVRGALESFGLVKLLYFTVLAVALGVTALLLADPALLQEVAPGWRGSMGLVLLCASILSMSIALARVVKAAALFVVWSAVSLVLASEVFLGKLPQNVLRDDLKPLQELIPNSIVSGVLNGLESAVSAGHSGLNALFLSGSPAASKLFSGQRGLGAELEDVLRGNGVDINVRDLSQPEASIYDLREAARRAMEAQKPDVVFIVGWASDASRGSNSYRLPGLTELEAREHLASLKQLLRYPLVPDILASRLFRYMANPDGEQGQRESAFRVPVQEYRSELAALVRDLRSQGVTVVLISEPSPIHAEEQEYRTALEDVAREMEVLYVNAQEVLAERSGNRHLGARGRLVSTEALSELAVGTVARLAEYAVRRDSQGGLATSLESTVDDDGSSRSEYVLSGLRGEAVNLVVKPQEAGGDLLFKVKHLDPSKRFYRVVFSVNGKFAADRRLNDRESTRVRFKIPEEFMSLPFVEISVRVVASPGASEDAVGSSDVQVPVPVSITAEGENGLLVRVGSEQLSSGEQFAISSIDPLSGEVIDTLVADESDQVGRWMTSQPWGNIIAGAGRASLSAESLKYLGLPRAEQPTPAGAFIGIVGGKPQSGIVAQGEGQQKISLGSNVLHSMSRFVLEEATVDGSGKSLLAIAR